MKYSKVELEEIVKDCVSIAGVCRKIGIRPVGGNYKTVKNLLLSHEIDISHFTGQGWNVGLKFRPNTVLSLEDILVEDSTYTSTYNLKRKLLTNKLKEYKCENCLNTMWMGKGIPLELHHINGCNMDNRIENLQLLCPNCHSQTDNFRGKKKSKSSINSFREEKFKSPPIECKNVSEQSIEVKPKHKKKEYVCLFCGKTFNSRRKHKYCSVECYKLDCKGNRPDYLTLINDFKTHNSFVGVGKKYGVSDNSVRKWCKLYGIPTHISEMKSFIQTINVVQNE